VVVAVEHPGLAVPHPCGDGQRNRAIVIRFHSGMRERGMEGRTARRRHSALGSRTMNRAFGLDSTPSAVSVAACSDKRMSPATEQGLPRPSRSRTFIRGGVCELPGCGPSRDPFQERWESPRNTGRIPHSLKR
jgi:hypothetical protein